MLVESTNRFLHRTIYLVDLQIRYANHVKSYVFTALSVYVDGSFGHRIDAAFCASEVVVHHSRQKSKLFTSNPDLS